MKYKVFFVFVFQCHYLSIYYTSCFWNHCTTLTIDIHSSARIAKARVTIPDRLVSSMKMKWLCHTRPFVFVSTGR